MHALSCSARVNQNKGDAKPNRRIHVYEPLARCPSDSQMSVFDYALQVTEFQNVEGSARQVQRPPMVVRPADPQVGAP